MGFAGVQAAENLFILVDANTIRHRVLDQIYALVEKTNLLIIITTPRGKGAVFSTRPNYRCDYTGVILEFDTPGFSYRASHLNTIDLPRTGYSSFSGHA
jgi:pyruvate decarboxylase